MFIIQVINFLSFNIFFLFSVKNLIIFLSSKNNFSYDRKSDHLRKINGITTDATSRLLRNGTPSDLTDSR